MLKPTIAATAMLLALPLATRATNLPPEAYRVRYGQNNTGPHIVFVAGEREYRSEESLPTLARILAKQHGFRCTVLFTLADDGTIQPQTNNLRGLNILDRADLLFIFARFLNLPDGEMAAFVRYLNSGKPIVALRTSTHAFRIPEGKYRKYDSTYPGQEYENGFGRQVLGETWVAHHGDNHLHSTRLYPVPNKVDHPVLRGVGQMHVVTGGYTTDPRHGSTAIVMAQPLDGMKADDPPHPAFQPVPAVWTRTRPVGAGGRVLTCTHGAARDLLDPGLRRLLINACFWATGLEDRIGPDLNIDFVGPYQPTDFAPWAWKKGVKPADLAGYDSPIMPGESGEAPRAYLNRLDQKRKNWEEYRRTGQLPEVK
ncbi:MAG: ThuA domain-containing protein [Planctomycetota bacterium]|jgi:hypothetical protein